MTSGPMPCAEGSIRSRTSPDKAQQRDRWVLIATILGSSMEFIDGTVVNVSLPNLQSAFHATGTQVQWVVEAYALFLSALLLVGGSMGDRFGLRRTFLAGILLFVSASVWCGLAPNIAQLLIARCLQGVGGSLLVPNSLAFLSANFSESARGKAIGTWSGFAAMMTALGPILGGLLVQYGSWRWVFFLNVPIGCATVWITVAKTGEPAVSMSRKPLDWLGAMCATFGLAGVTLCLMQWSTGGMATRMAGFAGLVFLVSFCIVERKAANPLLPLELFRSRVFSGANALTFFLYGALSAALFYLPLNLIQVQRYSPSATGAALLPLILMMFLLARWAGGLIGRLGPRLPLIVGPLVAAAGYALLIRPGVGGSYWATYFPAMLVLGLGMTISVAPLTTVVMSSVDPKRSGAASGVNNAVAQIAALLALAVASPFFYHSFARSLERTLSQDDLSPAVTHAVLAQEHRLAAIQTDSTQTREAVDDAFVGAFRHILCLASLSAAAAAGIAALTIRAQQPRE